MEPRIYPPTFALGAIALTRVEYGVQYGLCTGGSSEDCTGDCGKHTIRSTWDTVETGNSTQDTDKYGVLGIRDTVGYRPVPFPMGCARFVPSRKLGKITQFFGMIFCV